MLRRFLSHIAFIHVLVALGLFALWGFLAAGQVILALLCALSFSGAVCGAFIRVIDAIRNK